ncbi:MAG TPA: ABC transporter ATP-binding protein [Sedimentisphaerales bacterium]|nr:ABC transporter ATP-binding protein [Sedimentisphaerales bacterium]
MMQPVEKNSRPLLEIENLKVDFSTFDRGDVRVIDGVDLKIYAGETVAIVGESGSGKSVTAMSVMRLLDEPPAKLSGAIRFHGDDGSSTDILAHSPNSKVMQSLRGNRIAMIFQEPMRAMSPVFTVGYQVAEAVWLHQPVTKAEAFSRAAQMFEKVGISDAKNRLRQYPHEMSGGQRQRVMIAMALACNPRLLIADEPTTALDVTIQAQILELLKNLQKQFNLAICLITHDLGIVAQNCSRGNVMYMGRIVESADIETLYSRPCHPYTRGLLRSVPVPGRGHKQKLDTIEGTVPEPDRVPPGCAFGPRCSYFMTGLCDAPQPVPVIEISPKQWSRCYRAKEI